MEKIEKKINVIVVGAGPAGVACAVTVARAGKKVLLVERGDFSGCKNMFGGAVYVKPTLEIFPNFFESAPIERYNTEHRYALLDDDEATVISHKSCRLCGPQDYNSFTVLRAKWDRWCVKQAQKEGVYVAAQTPVRELIIEGNKVVGIKTDYENYYADIVVLADGVNSLLARQADLRKPLEPKNVALGVKEVIKLPKEVLQERFNLNDDEGCIYTVVGGALKSMLGLGYIYTNKNSVSIGIGVALSELKDKKKKPYELLAELKAHPVIQPLIKDGELIEYSAHLIPEGGYKAIPQLYSDGVMVVGDAAMLVNNVHWEGTNLAMMSGKFAGETAIEAIEKNDFSKNMLALYKKKLKNSFVMTDMKSYKDVMDVLHKRQESYLGYWIAKINQFFDMFTSVDSVAKKKKFMSYALSVFKDRKPTELIKDGFGFIKIIIGIFK